MDLRHRNIKSFPLFITLSTSIQAIFISDNDNFSSLGESNVNIKNKHLLVDVYKLSESQLLTVGTIRVIHFEDGWEESSCHYSFGGFHLKPSTHTIVTRGPCS